MDTALKERLRDVRKSLPQKTSQEAFAKLLGITRTAYNKYELGLVIPSDTFIQLLCTKFNIDEHWLRTGEGEMYKNDLDAQVESFAQKYVLTEEDREIMRYFFRLAPNDRKAMIEHVLSIADAIRSARADAAEKQQEAAPPAEEPPRAAEKRVSAAERAEMHRLLDEEIDAEEKARSVSKDGSIAKRA